MEYQSGNGIGEEATMIEEKYGKGKSLKAMAEISGIREHQLAAYLNFRKYYFDH